MLKCFTFLLKENELMMFSNSSVATIILETNTCMDYI
jgi:hypothetical protein